VLVLAACLAAMGINRFYGKPVAWRSTALITGATFVAPERVHLRLDSVPLRMLCYTTAQVLPMALSIRLLLSPENGRVSPVPGLPALSPASSVGIYGIRLVGALLYPGGEFFLFAVQRGFRRRCPGAGVPVDGAQFRLPG